MTVLHLYHGRNSPDEQLSDWGFDGPTLKIDWFHVTYMTTFVLGCNGGDELWLDDWSPTQAGVIVNSLFHYAGKFYGDWEIMCCGDSDVAALPLRPELAILPPTTAVIPPVAAQPYREWRLAELTAALRRRIRQTEKDLDARCYKVWSGCRAGATNSLYARFGRLRGDNTVVLLAVANPVCRGGWEPILDNISKAKRCQN